MDFITDIIGASVIVKAGHHDKGEWMDEQDGQIITLYMRDGEPNYTIILPDDGQLLECTGDDFKMDMRYAEPVEGDSDEVQQ